jgi:DNA-packaging protein gp3
MANQITQTGRPPLFKSPEELDIKIQSYFDSCDPHISTKLVVIELPDKSEVIANIEYMTEQVPYTVSGLARSLRTSRRTLLNYENKNQDFFHTLTRAKQKIEGFWETALFEPSKAQGAIFTLRNNWGWSKKVESTQINLDTFSHRTG